MPENFPNMEKKTNVQSQESQKVPQDESIRQRHTMINLLSTTNRHLPWALATYLYKTKSWPLQLLTFNTPEGSSGWRQK